MSEILCQWLNQELKVSQTVSPKSFAKAFSNGYLIGEVLHKFELQDDFAEFSESRSLDTAGQTTTDLLNTYSDDDYIKKIQKRLEVDAFAREQREKRRRRLLMDQLIAHEAQEEAYREEQLINRLMRQSQQERRIAVQLMHVRHEKEVLWQNRIFREKQYEERRLKDFQDALDREAVNNISLKNLSEITFDPFHQLKALARQAKIDFEEQAIREKEIHEQIAVERAQARYKKHYSVCAEILDQILDLSTKVADYRMLTNNLIPYKLMHDWKELFFSGKPIYEQASLKHLSAKPSAEQLVELEKRDFLDNNDYEEYKVLSIDTLVREAIQAFHNNEKVSEVAQQKQIAEEKALPVQQKPGTNTKKSPKAEEVIASDSFSEFTVRAQLGAKSERLLKKGKCVSDVLLVSIMVNAINQIPEYKGWILDGFPMTLNQAKLLEEALTGCNRHLIEMEGKKLQISTLAVDPTTSREVPLPPSAFDFVMLLDISDNFSLNRMNDIMVPYWNLIENSYINSIKTALRHLREDQHMVFAYLYDIRTSFQEFLRRPDHKQDFVSQWQADFNSLPDDLWDDEEMKAELHQRVNDLRDRLWDICDARKEEAEQERLDIINKSWLQDSIGITMNHFFSLMQAELNRFQDTKILLQDYYRGMECKIPTDDTKRFIRIPLVQLDSKDILEFQLRIPLVPRRSVSPDSAASRPKTKAILKGKIDYSLENVELNFEADEKTVIDTWQQASLAISHMVAAEIQQRLMEEEKESQPVDTKEKPLPVAANKKVKRELPPQKKKEDKKGKGKSSPTAEAAPVMVPVEVTAEVELKNELSLRIKEEHLTALQFEERATQFRLELIKNKALASLEDLVTKAVDVYKLMEKWLGERYLNEMASVEKLTEVARYHIETSTKIQSELYLGQEDFFIKGDLKVFPDPPPPVRPAPVEKEENGTLTIEQLDSLRNQFLDIAPKGRESNYYEKSRGRRGKVKIDQNGNHLSTSKTALWRCVALKQALAFHNMDLN
ncbi:hypothetical protein CB1_011123001 [Camelus ferus]|nr:hypothetical protein CB1_011123001 [Camelus ferus]